MSRADTAAVLAPSPPNLVLITGVREEIVELDGPGDVGGALGCSVLVGRRVARVKAAVSVDSSNQPVEVAVPWGCWVLRIQCENTVLWKEQERAVKGRSPALRVLVHEIASHRQHDVVAII